MANCSSCNKQINLDNFSISVPYDSMNLPDMIIFCTECSPQHPLFSDAPYPRKDSMTEESLTAFIENEKIVSLSDIPEKFRLGWEYWLAQRKAAVAEYKYRQIDENTYDFGGFLLKTSSTNPVDHG